MKKLPKKWMTCLKCGRKIWTDKEHRICKNCKRENEKLEPQVADSASIIRSGKVIDPFDN